VSAAETVATWSNGHPLLATRLVNGRLRVDLNVRPDTAPGAVLFANALLSEP
jgi:hypothetical protein